MLEVTDLTRTYGRGPGAHTAVTGVSLTVAQGELVSIVGAVGLRQVHAAALHRAG